MDENGGVVIAFGQSFFHIDCFKCAKCHDRVTADTNLLLLSDGQPVCSNCSYSCSVCHEPILDEAIMTGDDSYHAHCFKCRSCHNRIDELMFAKTSHGIYCMKCHHQRVARSRRHAQKQKERENATAGGPSRLHSRLKEQSGLSANTPVGPFTPDSALSSQPVSAVSLASQTSPIRHFPPGNGESGDSYRSQARSSLNGRHAAQVERDGRRSVPHTPAGSAPSSQRTSRNALSSPTSPSLPPAPPEPSASSRHSTNPSSPTIILPAEAPEAGPRGSMSYLQREPPNDSGAQSFLSPDISTSIERRKSYDDGTRPLNILFKNDAPSNSSQSLRLTDRASKRNSINPGTTFNYEAVAEAYKPVSTPESPLPNVLLTPDADRATILTDTRPLGSREQAAVEILSPPSRKAPAENLPSASGVTSSKLSRSRSRTEPKPTTGDDSVQPAGRQNMILERTPPRSHSLNTPSQDFQTSVRRLPPVASVKNGISGKAPSDEKDKFKHGSSLSIDVEKSRSGYSKRPMSPAHKATSPAHKVDVPRGIESGTDTSDGEREPSADEQSAQQLPPLRKETKPRPRPMQLDLDTKRTAPQDESFVNSAGDVDSEEESSPVERVSRSTFIAPAHPPIRVSISANGFQELLSLADPRKRSSLQSIEELVKLNQDAAARLDSRQSSSSLTLDSNVAQSEEQRSPASAATPTTLGSSSIADNASVTTISAPSSHGHGESFMVMDQHEKHNGVVSSPAHQLAVHDALPTSSNGHSSDVSPEPLVSGDQRGRLDPIAPRHTDANQLKHGARVTISVPDSVSRSVKPDPSSTVTKRLRDALQESARRSTTQIMLDQEFVQVIIMTIDQRKDENAQMKGKLDHIKRASKHAMDGLTVAHGEYDAELKARREAEAEVTRLRVLLSGQAARITALAGEDRRGELHKQLTRELSDCLSILEQDVSKLKAERDLALVEMEEIASTRSLMTLADRGDINISSSLSTRLDDLKAQYQGELVSLTDERESLLREIAELKSARDVFLEETTMLNARNEELAQLNAHYMRRIEAASSEPPQLARENQSLERQRPTPMLPPSHTANSSFGTSTDESADSTKYARVLQKPPPNDAALRVFKWRGNTKEAAATTSTGSDGANEKSWLRHAFQHVNVLRLTKCDHCGDKLWGSQVRCQGCHMSIHPRCQQHVQVVCSPQSSRRDEGTAVALQPSMFGRELTEQVRADSRVSDKMTPLLVEKCIEAVEANALDFEGIYRKTGGAGQSKLITQLFERGDYSSFDLLDTERFNDIGSVTSVLKSYFRTLPNPLLTFVLHDEFILASSIQDPVRKSSKYADLVKQLPTEHYYTLRMLMSHLHRVQEYHKQNLMTARNLGVVFGPTLMRSRNPNAEFSDMAGKALTVEWLVENAPTIFPPLSTTH